MLIEKIPKFVFDWALKTYKSFKNLFQYKLIGNDFGGCGGEGEFDFDGE